MGITGNHCYVIVHRPPVYISEIGKDEKFKKFFDFSDRFNYGHLCLTGRFASYMT